MTENVTTVTGVGATLPSNTTIGADNISSVYYERVKIAQGDTGTAVDVSSGAPFWVNIATTGNILGTFTTSTGVIGAVLPSSQWTVSVTPTSAIPVTGSFSLTSSTFVIGAVFPSTQWTVTTTPSSQINVTTTPSSQWTVSVTPTSAVSVTPTSVYQVSASAETATIFNGTASLTPTFATITATSSGIVQQVAGVSGKAIRIISAYLTVDGPTYISWTSSTTALNYSGLTYLTTGDGIVLPFNPVGWLQTTTTGALSINSSAPVTIGGAITYVSL